MGVNRQEIRQLDFEAAYQRLSSTAEKLEKGNLSLEEALGLYEEGMALSQHCSGLLDRAELRVTTISPGPDNPFEDEEELEETELEEEEDE